MSAECSATADEVPRFGKPKKTNLKSYLHRCKFSTSSAKEFSRHQFTAYNDSNSSSPGNQTELSVTLPLDIAKQNHNHPLTPGQSGTRSSDQPGSADMMFDSEMTEDEVENELTSVGDVDDRAERTTGRGAFPLRTYTCHDCGLSTTSARDHLYHQVEEHKYDYAIYECDICDYATRYRQKLPRHRKCHFNNPRPGVRRSSLASAAVRNNNNETFPKQTGVTNMAVFPDDPRNAHTGMDDENMAEDLNNMAQSSSQEDNLDQNPSTDENTNSSEAVQFEADSDDSDQVVLLSDMSGEDEKDRDLIQQPVKQKLLGKQGNLSPNILKPKPEQTSPVRMWVDQTKYVVLKDEEGVKYSCSKCGNIYKWRKSLCKHWKEKHDGETPPPVQSRASPHSTLIIPTVTNDKRAAASLSKYSPTYAHSKYVNSSPGKYEFSHHTSQLSVSPVNYERSPRSTYKISSHPTSPQLPSPNMAPSTGKIPKPAHSFSDSSPTKCDVDALDLSVKTQTAKSEEKNGDSNIQNQNRPLDFSSDSSDLVTQSKTNSSAEYHEKDHQPVLTVNENPRSFQCSQCAYVAVSSEDFKQHSETHTEKNFEQCGQCRAQFANVDDLNEHFLMEHEEQLEDFIEDKESPLKSQLMMAPVSQQMAALTSNCMVCSASFFTNYELAHHFSNAHSSLPNPYLKRNYVRLGVGKRKLEENLIGQPDAKRQRLVSDQVHTCISCGYKSSLKNDMILHMKKYHPAMMSRSQDSAATLSLSHHAYLADVPDNVDLSEEGTMLVIPKAPEENIKNEKVQKKSPSHGKPPKPLPGSSAEMLLPYKCTVCEYRARWPCEMTQHMKNHSDEKPYGCPRCTYRTKWKWDVVKHLKRCGGGTINDVIDTTKMNKNTTENTKTSSTSLKVTPTMKLSTTPAPPNVTVIPDVSLQAPPGGNSAEPDDKSGNIKPTVLRSIINQGQYHCFQCPFVGSSSTELKRHITLHSDEKPFSCGDCSYSSRWKCDLKKHLRTYSHKPSQKVALPFLRGRRSLIDKHSNSSPQMSPTASSTPTSHIGADSAMSESSAKAATILSASPLFTSSPSPSSSETSSQSGRSTLYKCEKCPYATYKKNVLESHMKIHIPRTETGNRLKCKQCDFEAADLPGFLQHKLTHSQLNQEQESDPSTPNISREDANTNSPSPDNDHVGHSVRHRRKPTRQFKCPKCPYVCFKRNGMLLHEAMHEPRDEDAHKCLYCDYNVYNADLLQQHLRLHPEHQQQQWDVDGKETAEAEPCQPDTNIMQQPTDMEDNDDGEQMDDNDEQMDENDDNDEQMDENDDNDEQMDGDNDDDFMNLDDEEEERLQRQVISQEMAIMATSAADHPALSDASSSDGLAVPDLAENNVATFSISDYEDRMARGLWTTSYQCKRCPYVTQYMSNYEKHVRMHGTNNKFTCEWCDWSIDRVNLLYCHAKSVHPDELANQEKSDFFDRVQDKSPVVLNMNSKPKKIKAVAPFYVESSKNESATDLSLPKSSTPNSNTATTVATKNNMANTSATTTPIATKNNMTDSSNVTTPIATKSNMADHPSWRASFSTSVDHTPDTENNNLSSSTHTVPAGVTVTTTIGKKRRKLYTCQKCGYNTDILSNIQRHCDKHGNMGRYVCDFCDYALDRKNLLWQHMKLVHKVTKKQKFRSLSLFNQSLSNSLNNSGLSAESSLLENRTSEADDSKTKERLNNDEAEVTFGNAYSDVTNEQLPVLQSVKDSADINLDLSTEFSVSADVTQKKEVMQMYKVGDKQMYCCGKCKYTTPNVTSCRNHIKQHGAGCQYTCEYCDYSVDQMHLLYHHMKTIHAEEMQHLETEMCTGDEPEQHCVEDEDDAQPAVSLLKTESKPKSEVKPLQSPRDGKQSPGKRKLYGCHFCPFKVKFKEALNKHLSMHEKKGKYICKYCNYSVDRRNLMCQHVRVHTPMCQTESLVQNKAAPSDVKGEKLAEKVPPLKITTKPKSSYISISRRISKLKNRLRYGCSMCPYTSSFKGNIAKHRKLHIIRSKYRCRYCNYSSARSFQLNLHLKCHEEHDKNEIAKVVYGSSIKKESGSSSPSSNQPENEGVKTKDVMFKVETVSEDNKESKTEASKQKPYMCKKCPFGTNSSFEIIKHLRLHGVSHKFKCDHCTYSINRLNLLHQHRKLHSKEEDFDPHPLPKALLNKPVWSKELMKIKDCTKTNSLNRNDGDEGEKSEENEMNLSGNCPEADGSRRKFQCKMCPQRCSATSKLKAHEVNHGLVRKFICDHCDWSSDRLNMLHQHRRVHRFEANYIPDVPRESFINVAFEQNSPTPGTLSILPQLPTTSQPKTRFRVSKFNGKSKFHCCKLCPYSCDNKTKFAHHTSLHGSAAQYQCEKCSYSVSRLNLLYQHRKLHKLSSGGQKKKASLPKKRLKCPKCPYHTHSYILLNHHSTLHAAGKRHTCQFCDYSIDRRNLLQQHMRCHLEDNSSDSSKVEVKVKDVKVTQTPSTKIHGNEVTTSPEKRRLFFCDRCPYTTSSRPNFENHKLQHSSRNKLRCSFCDYSIGRIDHMMNHVKLHLPNSSVASDELNAMIIRSDENGPSLADSIATSQVTVAEETSTDTQQIESVSKRHENKVTTSAEKRRLFFCDRCPYTTSNRPNFENHKVQHSSRNKLRCSFCDYSIGRIDHMMNHVKMHLPNNSKASDELNTVIVRSDEDGPSLADSIAMSQVTVAEETSTDTQQKENASPRKASVYVCQYCDRRFDNEQTMKRHEAQHLIGY